MSRVYVGRLPPRVTERDIERFFKGYGRLRDVVLKSGYGFVEFDNEKDADDAVYDLHGRDLRGERIVVEHARLPPGNRGGGAIRRTTGTRERRYGPPTRTEYRVIVENLSSRVSWQDLKDMMRKAGDVTYADAHKSSKNDGIVEFAAYGDMKEAIDKFDGYELYGRRLRVYEDRPSNRSRSGSYDRSRSNSGRRSRSRDYSRQKSRSYRRSRSDSRSRQSSLRHSRDNSLDRSRSMSDRSMSRGSRDRSSKHSDRRSFRPSRSPSRNGRELKKGSNRHSKSYSRSRSRSRSIESRSPRRSNSGSKSRSISRSRSVSPRSVEIDDSRRSNDSASRENDFD